LSVKEQALVYGFDNIRNTDVSIVGGKNASLGEMINAKYPFHLVSRNCLFLREIYLEKKIAEQIYKIIKEPLQTQTTPNNMMLHRRKFVNSSKNSDAQDIENAVDQLTET